MGDAPFLLNFGPGIQRDGTRFDNTRYLDGEWCRWRLGRPRKIGGYQLIMGSLDGLPRKIHAFYQGQNIIAHVGTSSGIQQVVFDTEGNFVSSANRTPAGFVGGADVGWTIDAIFDTTSQVVQLVAHSVPDLRYQADPIQTVPFLGQIDSTTPLAEFSNPGTLSSGVWTQPKVAGGIVCVQPFIFDFDNAGLVQWSAPNLPLYLGVVGGSTGAGQARISAQKIVSGMPLRGGGAQQPAALFWSLSEVILASYVGTTSLGAGPWFAFSTVSPSSSILSGQSVVEYDGLYFWVGVDRFLVFNGTVAEVPNPLNQDFFFDNLTPGYESMTFGFKVPRYGEIWWCAAMFGATEPNHAVIFNVRENCWYDTPLPDGGRSAAYFAQGQRFPIMTDVVNGGSGYGLWMHETGVDRVSGAARAAIRSFFETAWIGGPTNSPPDDRGMDVVQIEPDVIQSGDLSCTVIGAANARAPDVPGPTSLIKQIPSVPQEEFASFVPRIPTRLARLHIESNVVGGNYIFGKSLGRGQPAERRLNS
jgi:hypothetical protein